MQFTGISFCLNVCHSKVFLELNVPSGMGDILYALQPCPIPYDILFRFIAHLTDITIKDNWTKYLYIFNKDNYILMQISL